MLCRPNTTNNNTSISSFKLNPNAMDFTPSQSIKTAVETAPKTTNTFVPPPQIQETLPTAYHQVKQFLAAKQRNEFGIHRTHYIHNTSIQAPELWNLLDHVSFSLECVLSHFKQLDHQLLKSGFHDPIAASLNHLMGVRNVLDQLQPEVVNILGELLYKNTLGLKNFIIPIQFNHSPSIQVLARLLMNHSKEIINQNAEKRDANLNRDTQQQLTEKINSATVPPSIESKPEKPSIERVIEPPEETIQQNTPSAAHIKKPDWLITLETKDLQTQENQLLTDWFNILQEQNNPKTIKNSLRRLVQQYNTEFPEIKNPAFLQKLKHAHKAAQESNLKNINSNHVSKLNENTPNEKKLNAGLESLIAQIENLHITQTTTPNNKKEIACKNEEDFDEILKTFTLHAPLNEFELEEKKTESMMIACLTKLNLHKLKGGDQLRRTRFIKESLSQLNPNEISDFVYAFEIRHIRNTEQKENKKFKPINQTENNLLEEAIAIISNWPSLEKINTTIASSLDLYQKTIEKIKLTERLNTANLKLEHIWLACDHLSNLIGGYLIFGDTACTSPAQIKFWSPQNFTEFLEQAIIMGLSAQQASKTKNPIYKKESSVPSKTCQAIHSRFIKDKSQHEISDIVNENRIKHCIQNLINYKRFLTNLPIINDEMEKLFLEVMDETIEKIKEKNPQNDLFKNSLLIAGNSITSKHTKKIKNLIKKIVDADEIEKKELSEIALRGISFIGAQAEGFKSTTNEHFALSHRAGLMRSPSNTIIYQLLYELVEQLKANHLFITNTI